MISMPMVSPALMTLTAVATMVAMMLPSFAPTLWRYHRDLRALEPRRAGGRTVLFAAAYLAVWAAIGLLLVIVNAGLSPMEAPMAREPFAPSVAGAVVLCAGLLQRSRWKERHLFRCREACVEWMQESVTSAWRAGYRLGIDCGLSCAAPMAMLLIAGLMDARMMVAATVAITAERVAPAGQRIARLTGSLAVVTGLVMCLRVV